jgi:hypothetical protein
VDTDACDRGGGSASSSSGCPSTERLSWSSRSAHTTVLRSHRTHRQTAQPCSHARHAGQPGSGTGRGYVECANRTVTLCVPHELDASHDGSSAVKPRPHSSQRRSARGHRLPERDQRQPVGGTDPGRVPVGGIISTGIIDQAAFVAPSLMCTRAITPTEPIRERQTANCRPVRVRRVLREKGRGRVRDRCAVDVLVRRCRPSSQREREDRDPVVWRGTPDYVPDAGGSRATPRTKTTSVTRCSLRTRAEVEQ